MTTRFTAVRLAWSMAVASLLGLHLRAEENRGPYLLWKGEGNGMDAIAKHDLAESSQLGYAQGVSGQAFLLKRETGPRIGLTDPALKPYRNTFTVAFWAKPTAGRAQTEEASRGIYGISGQNYALFPQHGGTGLTGGAGMGVSVGTNGVSVFEHREAYMPSVLVYDRDITDWIHVAVVYRDYKPSLYLNGSFVRQGIDARIRDEVSPGFVFPSSSIGGHDSLAYGPYDGLIDEVNVFAEALSENELKLLVQTGSASTKRPIARWRGDNSIEDDIGLLDLFSLDEVAFAPGKFGQAFSFSGKSGSKLSAYERGIQSISNSFSMVFWAKPSVGRVKTAEATRGISALSGQNFALFPEHGGFGFVGGAGIGVSVGTNGISLFEHRDAHLPSVLVVDERINRWRHIGVIYDNYVPRVYVDGKLMKVGADSHLRDIVSPGNLFPSGSLGGHEIGYGPYAGLLDEVAIYDYALSVDQLKNLAEEFVPPDRPPKFSPEPGYFTNSVRISMTASGLPGEIRFTTDGSAPTPQSRLYSGPTIWTAGVTIIAQRFVDGIPIGESETGTWQRVYALDDGIPVAWRQRFFGPGYLTDSRAAGDADPDGDGSNNLQEFVSGTNPMDPLSGFAVKVRAVPQIRWKTVVGERYQVLRKRSLTDQNWEPITAIVATGTEGVYTDAGIDDQPSFYTVQPIGISAEVETRPLSVDSK